MRARLKPREPGWNRSGCANIYLGLTESGLQEDTLQWRVSYISLHTFSMNYDGMCYIFCNLCLMEYLRKNSEIIFCDIIELCWLLGSVHSNIWEHDSKRQGAWGTIWMSKLETRGETRKLQGFIWWKSRRFRAQTGLTKQQETAEIK